MVGWSDLLTAADNATGGTLPASAIVPIAQGSANPTDAATNAQGTAGMLAAETNARALEQQPKDAQIKAWKTLSKADQQLYQSAGYKPIRESEGGIGGFLNRYVVHDVVKPVAGALGPATHDVFNALGSGLRAVQHVERAGAYIARTNISNPGGDPNKSGYAQPFEAIISPTHWAQAWDRTTNGAKTFDPYWDRQGEATYGADTWNLAKRVASGEKPTDIVKQASSDPNGPKNADGFTPAQALAQQFQSPEFARAAQAADNAHLTLGHVILGDTFMNHNPVAGRILSGSIDGAFDFFADPTGKALAAGKGFNDARYLIQTPEDLQRAYNGSSAVRGLYQQVADAVASRHASTILNNFPRLQSFASDMIAKEVDTPEKVNQYMKDFFGMVAVLKGTAARVGDEPGFLASHLTVGNRIGQAVGGALGPVADAVSGVPVIGKTAAFLTHPVDFLASAAARAQDLTPQDIRTATETVGSAGHPFLNAALHPIVSGEMALGRTAQAMVRLDPTVGGRAFDLEGPNALGILRDWSSAFLPPSRVNQLIDDYAAKADTAGRLQVYKGIVDEVGAAAGVHMTPESEQWWQGLMNQLGKSEGHYSYAGNDSWDNGETTAGLLEGHMQTEVSMPKFSELMAQTKKISVTRSIAGAVNNSLVDHAMRMVWKPLTLFHAGFVMRVALDEMMGAALREGIPGLVKARLAASLDNGSESRTAVLGRRVLDLMTGHLGSDVQAGIKTPEDLVAANLADQTARAFPSSGFSLDDYRAATDELGKQGFHDGVLPEVVSAIHGKAGGYMEDGRNIVKDMKNGRLVNVRLTPAGGGDRPYAPGERLYHYNYGANLDEIAKSRWARVALANIDAPVPEAADVGGLFIPTDNRQARVAEVADTLQGDPFWKQMAKRSKGTSDSRTIIGGEVTERQAALDHAERIVNHVDNLVNDATGTPLQTGEQTMAEFLLENKKSPTVAALTQIPEDRLPIGVRGPDIVPVPVNAFSSLISKGMDNLVGRPLNWMVRQPLFIHNYTESKAAMTTEGGVASQLAAKYPDNKNINKMVSDLAMERALNKTIPFIHDPQLRSQMSVIGRNLSPFWFAQEQAYKRWARTFLYAPQAMRQMQMLNSGLQHSGIVHTDQQTGQHYFLYPGVDFADRKLNQLAEKVTGGKFTLPIGADLQGSTSFLSPIRDNVLPTFGPVVAMPLTALVNHFPELQPLKQAVMGKAQNAQYLKELVPSTLYSVLDAVAPNLINHQQYNSAWMQTIRMFEATGQGLRPDATPEQVQALLDRTKNFTRIRILLRAVLGFGAAPAAPQFSLDNLDQKLQTLMSQLPVDQALAVYSKTYPNATANEVFQSRSVSGAPLASTKEAMDWMNNNKALIAKYPYAAAYLMPQTPGPYDQTAYLEQLATGLRIRKTPDQFLNDILYQQAATAYFTYDQQKSQLLAQTHSSYTKTQINHIWDQWSAQYLAQHPVFAKVLTGGPDGLPPAQWTRQQVQAELVDALNNNPALKANPAYDTLRTLANNYDHYQGQIAGMVGYNSSYYTMVRKQLGEGYAFNWLQYVHLHPETEAYFNRVIRPAMTTAINALGVTA